MIDDPIVLDPPGFDTKAAWDECREYVEKCGGLSHEDGEPNWRAAFGADPGCCACPRCHESYWAWGRIQKCKKCGAEYETQWWAMLSWGVQAGRNADKRRFYEGRYKHSAVMQWGIAHPDCSLDTRVVFTGTDWIDVWAGKAPYVKEDEMVDGKVVGIVRRLNGETLLNVEDDHCGKGPTDRCAVCCVETPLAVIGIGDSVWWQAGKVYWTPGRNRKDYPAWRERPRDVPLSKVGYSH